MEMTRILNLRTGLLSLVAAVLLSACGGGSSSTAVSTPVSTVTPTPGAPMISGTVSGFGSLLIDGTRVDNHAVAAMVEKENGVLSVKELKLGQHVEVQHDGKLVATQVRVRSMVEGVVQRIDLTAGSLQVMGQTITVNSNPALGPVTVYESPYTQLSDVKVNDNIEVHALVKIDALGKSSLQATRIEKRDADGVDRVHGIVSALSTATHTFKLGDLQVDYTDAKLLPANAILVNGAEVQVSIAAGTAVNATTVKAMQVNLIGRKAESEGKEVELGGAISFIDTATKIIRINGISIDLSAASFNQPGKSISDLKMGSYVVVKGSYTSDTAMKATTVVIRGVGDNADKLVELHGSILDFQSNADFEVRGITVDASTAKIDLTACPVLTALANNLQVEVLGNVTPAGILKAVSVKCESVRDAVSVLGRHGVVSQLDGTALTFTLKAEKESFSVKWSAATTFVRVTAATLDGKIVNVEGTVVNGVLQAEKIILAQK